MKVTKKTFNLLLIFLTLAGIYIYHNLPLLTQPTQGAQELQKKELYWFELQRSDNIENLYKGIPGDKAKSTHIRSFRVKSGIPGERPTPLPKLVGRDYWLVTDKQAQVDNPETAPYFLTLNIPVSDEEPFGPVPYEECGGLPASTDSSLGGQCNWILPGAFGLHGSGGNLEKLSDFDPGSSGCIRHSDEEITYLYNLLNPEKEEIRYYIVE